MTSGLRAIPLAAVLTPLCPEPAGLKVNPARLPLYLPLEAPSPPVSSSSHCTGILRFAPSHVDIQRCPAGPSGSRLQADRRLQGGQPPAESEPGGWR